VAARDPQAIIDIGSNSVRLVVYSGAARVPAAIFNEKVLAGLGLGLGETGELSADSRRHALAALARFRLLIDHMRVERTHVVATAAVRDARNGPEFVKEIRRLGLKCQVLDAADEARLAGEGVLSAIPGASGIVGDLGGGSLELVEIGDGHPGSGISLPLGVLRVKPGGSGEKRAAQTLKDALKHSGLDRAARGRSLYMVGGSWRALGRVDMIATEYPLPITQQYSMAPERATELRKAVASADPRLVKAIAPARLASTPAAAMVLEHLVELLEPRSLVLSSFGIREGLLYSRLSDKERAKDPLIEAARDFGGGERRFGQHGDLLDQWIGGIFEDSAPMRRLRLAACLLADVAWRANSDFRAERGVEMALHGAWVGVTPAERVVMAQALSSNFGRERLLASELTALCQRGTLERAHRWGLAMRLAQRLSGGVASALSPVSLALDHEHLQLRVERAEAALVGDPVQRRLQRLAESLGLIAEVVPV
jgi:exopolyphosphatase/guanosine-5'-triphosphate,3'-diphosphate pyrophosphatase